MQNRLLVHVEVPRRGQDCVVGPVVSQKATQAVSRTEKLRREGSLELLSRRAELGRRMPRIARRRSKQIADQPSSLEATCSRVRRAKSPAHAGTVANRECDRRTDPGVDVGECHRGHVESCSQGRGVDSVCLQLPSEARNPRGFDSPMPWRSCCVARELTASRHQLLTGPPGAVNALTVPSHGPKPRDGRSCIGRLKSGCDLVRLPSRPRRSKCRAPPSRPAELRRGRSARQLRTCGHEPSQDLLARPVAPAIAPRGRCCSGWLRGGARQQSRQTTRQQSGIRRGPPGSRVSRGSERAAPRIRSDETSRGPVRCPRRSRLAATRSRHRLRVARVRPASSRRGCVKSRSGAPVRSKCATSSLRATVPRGRRKREPNRQRIATRNCHCESGTSRRHRFAGGRS